MSHNYGGELLSHGLGLFAGEGHQGVMNIVKQNINDWHGREKEWKQASLAERDSERMEWRKAS